MTQDDESLDFFGDKRDRFARNLDWNLLRTFLVIAQAGSITGAARRLTIQQPAVSAALKRLEQFMGRKLIDRRPGHFALTPAGHKVYVQASEVFGAVARLPDLTSDQTNLITGHIRVYVISNASNRAWDKMLGNFLAKHPNVSLSISVETTTEVILAVERRVATMGLCDGVIPETLSKKLYAREHYGLFCGRGHVLFGRDNVTPDELRGLPFVSFTADVLGGEHMGPVTAVRALASFGHVVRAASANVEEVQRLIRANAGIGMLPVHLSRDQVKAGELWPLPLGEDLPVVQTFQIYNPNAALNQAEQAFLKASSAVKPVDHF